MDTFGVGDLVHSGFIYDQMNTFSFDLAYFEKWCRKASGDVLELCCGTGRLTIPLRQAGIPITGLDFTPSMLDRARQKARQAGVKMEFIAGDMRSFQLDRRFGLIFIPFNSLQNTYTREDVERILANVRHHLAPGGLFLVDVFNPDINLMIEREERLEGWARVKLEDGRAAVVTEQCAYDAASQVNRVSWFFRIEGQDQEEVQKLDMRCFFPQEMDALLHYNGFRIVHKFGSFEEEPFSSASRKQIYVCQATDGAAAPSHPDKPRRRSSSARRVRP